MSELSPRKLHLWRMATRPDPDLHAVAAELATIPELAAAVVRYANSAYIGSVYPAGTVLESVIRVGCRTVGALALASAGREVMDSWGTDEDWAKALVVGRAAKLVGRLAGLDATSSEYLFTAGLFSGVGTMALQQRDGGYLEWRRTVRRGGAEAPELLRQERMIYDEDHASAGGRLLEGWHLPSRIAAAVAGHHSVELMPFDAALVAAMSLVDGPTSPEGCLDLTFESVLSRLGVGDHAGFIREEASLFADTALHAFTERPDLRVAGA